MATPKVVMEYVTDTNEARTSVHPLEKNFAYYMSYMNISDMYMKHRYNQSINLAIKKYKTAKLQAAVNTLKIIKKEKFGKTYVFTNFILSQFLIWLRRYRNMCKFCFS